MAFQDTRSVNTNTLNKGINKDIDPQYLKEGVYTHAINARLNSDVGDSPVIQNEPGNKLCLNLPYTYIGSIPLKNNRFAVFSTDNTKSEIGVFSSTDCTYKKIVNDSCLNFNTAYLIRGVSKENKDNTESIYFCDNYNNNRTLNLDKVPYKYTLEDDVCKTKNYTDKLDCAEIELDQHIKIPCASLEKSTTGGDLRNGSYQVAVSYSVEGQSITDIYPGANIKSHFSHENLGTSFDVTIENLDTDFPEYNLHLLVTIAQQTTMYLVGTYKTTQNKVNISVVRPTDTTVPLQSLYLTKIANKKAENVVAINNQLIWSSPTTRRELNYQPSANRIELKWAAYAVPVEDKNSDLQSYMRDEVYAFSIGWKYLDGTKTDKYPIIGRTPTAKDIEKVNTEDAYELFLKDCNKKTDLKRWQVYNTATGAVSNNPVDKCEYKLIGTGEFGYHESTENYPDNKLVYEHLACTPIRHFRFPDDSIVPRTLKDANGVVTHTIHLGVLAYNVEHPVDHNGDKVTDVQGYEIYRADRTTEKTILGKGLLFNMGEYEIPTTNKNKILGAYPNYPYNDLKVDGFLSKTQTEGSNNKEKGYTALGTFSKTLHTFHSPSFSFNKPSFGTELKIEGNEYGNVLSNYVPVHGHPKNRLLTDAAFVVAAMLGLAEAYFATKNKTIITTVIKTLSPMAVGSTVAGPASGLAAAILAFETAVDAAKIAGKADPTGVIEKTLVDAATKTLLATAGVATGLGAGEITVTKEEVDSVYNSLPTVFKALNGIFLFSFYFQKGMETAFNLIRSLSKSEQYAYQVNSVCNYENFTPTKTGTKRRYIEDVSYLYPTMQQFGNITVNNFRRESSVIIKLAKPLDFVKTKDTSRRTMSEANACASKSYTGVASSYYAAIKQDRPSQYGQVQNIRWINTGYCNYIEDYRNPKNSYNTGIILGGDTFIGKFSLKRKMHYFNQSAFNENEDFEFDYRKYQNLPYARYWMDSSSYELSELVSFDPQLPNDKSHLDCKKSTKKLKDKLKSAFVTKDQHFYLSNNGVVEFYTESEVNLNNRDWEEQPFYRHYDQENYSDINTLLRSDNLEYDNRYIYDRSYSKNAEGGIGFTQDTNFNPTATHYSHRKNRVYYSLPNNKELVQDNWRAYLANNYYDFPEEAGNLTGMQVLDRTNIAFFFDESAPYLHQAIDQLQTDAGLKIQIGDGGLFARQPQPIISTDVKYGSSQSKYAFTNSQYGVLYPSVSNGRVFLLQGTSPKEISRDGLHFWFQNNMAHKLLKDFPNYKHTDNTVIGIGYLTTFDNMSETYYLTKVDYTVRKELKGSIFYDDVKDSFYLKRPNGSKVTIPFKDLNYFEDCSWTVSYSAKMQSWVSFHDWHGNANIQTENHFITVNTKDKCTLWKHNERCDKFCSYYGTQYSFDVESVFSTGQTTSTLSNIEYVLECDLYENGSCINKHPLLDYNFNKAFIYNKEQVSGTLNLNLASKRMLSQVLLYPRVNSNSIDIEFHKEEQKYRFNQFWDVTRNRAEFNNNYVHPIVENTNGYRFELNPDYINYAKPLFERKKFRHNYNKVYLSKMPATGESMPEMRLKLVNTKTLNSPR